MSRENSAGPVVADAGQDAFSRPVLRPLVLLDQGLTRLGLHGPFGRDLLLGVFVTLGSLALLSAIVVLARAEGGPFTPNAVAALTVLTVVQSVVVCVRRSAPLLCLSAVVATQVALITLLPPDAAFQGLASFFVAYTCGTVLPLRQLIPVFVTVAAVLGLFGFVFASPPFAPPSSLTGVSAPVLAGTGRALSSVLTFGVPALVGNDVAMRRRYTQLERLRVIEAEKERTERAIRDERTRVARELHDVAAHHLSGMVVQAGAAEKLAGRDSPAVAETISWIRVQGKETLENMRLVVGALREAGEQPRGEAEGEPSADGAPVPGIAVLDRLVAGERAQGSEVTLERTGTAHELPPAADVTFYRVTQEALANARDHAWGARVHVELHHRESETVLQVDNGPGSERDESPKGSRGLGLLGMKERADLIGAELETGTTDSGGWRVRLALPVDRPPLH
ncbi:sensor histidine kinase [Nocardiopsis xinjiangensis]|uniref:sensor histidine kinase n=1 Tax=Nocardiopsis xinjiangensis TaxID=124285 RepID=UPI000348D3EB|nr:histidine kinase [Nocardiopsis xinjiangensis]